VTLRTKSIFTLFIALEQEISKNLLTFEATRFGSVCCELAINKQIGLRA